jgi:hypothetical protein
MAREQVAQFKDAASLRRLAIQVLKALDEAAALKLLDISPV